MPGWLWDAPSAHPPTSRLSPRRGRGAGPRLGSAPGLGSDFRRFSSRGKGCNVAPERAIRSNQRVPNAAFGGLENVCHRSRHQKSASFGPPFLDFGRPGTYASLCVSSPTFAFMRTLHSQNAYVCKCVGELTSDILSHSSALPLSIARPLNPSAHVVIRHQMLLMARSPQLG